MYSNKIGEQAFAVAPLSGHLKAERIAPTYMLTGTESSGGEDVARAFAAALNCTAGNPFADCSCGPCHKAAAGNHPDILILGADPDARSIKIEEVRRAIDAAALKPYEGKWKVFVVLGAERLTMESQNALLKTLEEPPAHTVFVLVTKSRANVLETIQSRSFEIRLKPLAGGGPPPDPDMILQVARAPWEDFLDENGTTRDKLIDTLDFLMTYFQNRIRKVETQPGFVTPALEAFLDALDQVIESKEALEANTNPKLVASRLAMQLRRALPQGSLS